MAPWWGRKKYTHQNRIQHTVCRRRGKARSLHRVYDLIGEYPNLLLTSFATNTVYKRTLRGSKKPPKLSRRFSKGNPKMTKWQPKGDQSRAGRAQRKTRHIQKHSLRNLSEKVRERMRRRTEIGANRVPKSSHEQN